jgi:hypothetical protein
MDEDRIKQMYFQELVVFQEFGMTLAKAANQMWESGKFDFWIF